MSLGENIVNKSIENKKKEKTKDGEIDLKFIKEKITEDVLKKSAALMLLIFLLYILIPFKNLLLLTFIMTFIFSKMQNFIYDFIREKIHINKKIITLLIFFFIIGIIAVLFKIYIPKLVKELFHIKDIILNVVVSSDNSIINKYSQEISNIDFIGYLQKNSNTTLKTLSFVQEGAVTFCLSLVLSLFFLLEEKQTAELDQKLSNSKIAFFYNYYKSLGEKFLNSFGKVIQVQLVIAVINSILSVIGLMIIGFPEPIALGFMILILSLIPVLGVIVSLIPLSLIAFKIGGINKVIVVLGLIAILHALESYVISPKLMSEKSKLPIYITFFALIIGEHLFGVWGLLLTIPLIMFFMELLDIK